MRSHLSFSLLFALISALALASCQTVPYQGHASSAVATRNPSSVVDRQIYVDFLAGRVRKISEFEVIRKWAEKEGVRVWLGGGSATGVAVYAREELLAKGKQAERFPWSYFDIYRSTQDADIVLDATEAQAQKLEKLLQDELGYLQGSKKIWEVRLLKESRGVGAGKKDPILGSADFRNQNSDSFSTALVELTAPPPGESILRDSFDWENTTSSQSLLDILDGKLTFYRNPLHSTTGRARAGYNPEVVSVIRALTKSFQYDAEIRPKSLVEMAEIVRSFDPAAALDSNAERYILANSKKLFQHSRDIERTWNTLEHLEGFRQKLIQFAQQRKDSPLAILLNREPLRSFPVGQAPEITDLTEPTHFGKTAHELGITVVAHETSTFLAYENITMALDGKPNLFVSREKTAGEAAAYGWGAYTKRGKSGGRGTHLTVRFDVQPNAICGRDFFVAKDDQYVIFRNALALSVLPEDRIEISLSSFLNLLGRGNYSVDDLGVLKKLELKVQGTTHSISAEDRKLVLKIWREDLDNIESARFNFVTKLVGEHPDVFGAFSAKEAIDRAVMFYEANADVYTSKVARRKAALDIVNVGVGESRDLMKKYASYLLNHDNSSRTKNADKMIKAGLVLEVAEASIAGIKANVEVDAREAGNRQLFYETLNLALLDDARISAKFPNYALHYENRSFLENASLMAERDQSAKVARESIDGIEENLADFNFSRSRRKLYFEALNIAFARDLKSVNGEFKRLLDPENTRNLENASLMLKAGKSQDLAKQAVEGFGLWRSNYSSDHRRHRLLYLKMFNLAIDVDPKNFALAPALAIHQENPAQFENASKFVAAGYAKEIAEAAADGIRKNPENLSELSNARAGYQKIANLVPNGEATTPMKCRSLLSRIFGLK